ncbi:helix-turn-helix domain-containing protein [Isoptericola sp. b441]|uniref:Helix-turn-helix domain-containing protein n=1 Tax=Actinotalea lenta TaxID=3064654 RepID=A0ABT9DD38_9CELL|nr:MULTISPECIES: helix-turn-helix domain-containing protein [unclassified Isoptericola]MDO8108128.1 helix-turn-helix domain-containing protein [Isoptericola sp. b441]MDO8120202.1 helix-turn-helix domain-containing protein [Isoptericola sp. b490]
MTELSDRVRAERVRAGLSQTALAGDDFSPSYVSLIEAGRRTPTDRALTVLAERLGTTPDYLRYGDKAPSEERARLELGYARLALANGEAADARERLLALDLSTIAPRHRVEARFALAQAHEALGDLDAAVSVLEPLLNEARSQGRWLQAANQAAYLVAIYVEAGDLSHSIELGEEVLAELEAAGLSATDEHLRLASSILWSYYQRGDLLFAAHRASGLIELAERDGTRRGRGSVYWNASLVAEGRGEYAEARRLTERALAYLSEAEPTRDVPRLRLHYGWLLLRSNPPEPVAALEQLQAAAEGLVNVGTELELARCMFETGRAHLLLGDAARAEELTRASLERIGDSGDFDACDAHIVLGDALAATGRLDEALVEYRWSADRLAMLSAGRQSASVWRSLGDRLVALGDPAGASGAYATALDEAGIRPTTFSMTTRLPLAVGFGELGES